MSCCEPSPEDEARKAEDAAMLESEVTLNGVTLKLKDMFPDAWAARDFYTKLKLLNKAKGGKDLLDPSPESMMDEESGS